MIKKHLTARRLFFVWIFLAFVLAWSGSAPAMTDLAMTDPERVETVRQIP